MNHYRSLTLTVFILLICSTAAVASEKFVVSATDGTKIILQKYELDQNQIRMIGSNVIETNDWIGNTAVTFRNDNNTLIFDVYYYACLEQDDIECVNATLSMNRVDSKLNFIFRKDFTIPVAYSLATERLQTPSGPSLRLLLEDREKIAERELNEDGMAGSPGTVAFHKRFYSPSAAEDGKMVVASGGNNIQVRTFHPKGPIRVMQTDDLSWSPTLSGPVTRATQSLSERSLAKSYRFLFFRAFRNSGTTDFPSLRSRIMRLKIDDSTGDFIGTPKAITKFKAVQFFEYGQSVTVTQGADIVFFTEFDTSCRKTVLKAQVFNPQTHKKVGPSQLLIGCSQLFFGIRSISGIDVVQFRP